MNGWWCCFRCLFEPGGSRKGEQAKKLELEIMEEIKDKDNEAALHAVKGIYNNRSSEVFDFNLFRTLLKYLSLVYTIGNMAPAPFNPGGGGFGEIDLWEYKLYRYEGLYHDGKGDIDRLHFEDYRKYAGKIKNLSLIDYMKDFDIGNYMEERIDLILRRGYRIVSGKPVRDEELADIKSCIL